MCRVSAVLRALRSSGLRVNTDKHNTGCFKREAFIYTKHGIRYVTVTSTRRGGHLRVGAAVRLPGVRVLKEIKKSFTLNFKMTEVSGLVRQGLEASMLTYFFLRGSEFCEPNMHKFFYYFFAHLRRVWRSVL